MKDTGIVNIHGKEYKTVAKRVDEFRKEHKTDYSIVTSLVSIDEKTVVMKAEISDKENRLIATGYAEENRQASQINRTSALENCETSAIGRALANFGLAGGEYASADEVAQAISQQNQPKVSNTTRLDFDAIRETLDSIDDNESLDKYGEELKKKHPRMTKAQADAIGKMFNKRREEIKQESGNHE